MIRKAMVMKLLPGNEVEYARRHQPIWPELEAKIREHGASNYSIFRRGLELFAYVELESEDRWNALAQTEVVQRWWAHMQPLMETNPDNSPIGEELEEVFHID